MNFKLVCKKGSGKREFFCADCGRLATYHDKYDVFACNDCDQWLDLCDCSDNDYCPYPKPPSKPSFLK